MIFKQSIKNIESSYIYRPWNINYFLEYGLLPPNECALMAMVLDFIYKRINNDDIIFKTVTSEYLLEKEPSLIDKNHL